MAKIVVIDDDRAIISVIRKILEVEGHDIFDAYDGNIAKEVIQKERPECIISDIRIPEVSGLDLLAWSRETHPVPFILITGFAHLVETRKAYELGASQFITKPFEREELLNAVKKCLSKETEEDEEEFEYCKVSIDEFVSGSMIPYRIFLKLSDKKYVNIAHNGEDLTMERIKLFKAKGVKDLYLQREDFRKYLGFTTHLSKVALKSDKIPKAKKINLVKQVGELIIQSVHVEGVDESVFSSAREFVENATSLLADADDAYLLLESLRSSSDRLFRHSVAVSMYSVMIGRNMGIRTPHIVTKLSVGGLFHDIGKKNMSRAILEKPRAALTADEVKETEDHPVRGTEMLAGVRSISSDILQIVLQHHEDCLGYGFPQKLKKNKIHPLARIVSVANVFVEVSLESSISKPLEDLVGNPGPGNPEPARPLSGKDAVLKMIETYQWKLDKDALIGLLRLFSINEKILG